MRKMYALSILTLSLFFFSSLKTSEDADRLAKGELAPKFKTQDVQGTVIKFQKKIKEHPKTLIVFLRHAWCPICNVRTHELVNNFETLKAKGIGVIVVYQSKQEQLINYVQDSQLPYTVIADPQGKLYQEYKVERNAKLVKRNISDKSSPSNKLFKKGVGLYKKPFKSQIAEGEKSSDLIPADFLINKDGRIENAYYGKFVGDHLPIEDLLKEESIGSKNTSPQKVSSYTRFQKK